MFHYGPHCATEIARDYMTVSLCASLFMQTRCRTHQPTRRFKLTCLWKRFCRTTERTVHESHSVKLLPFLFFRFPPLTMVVHAVRFRSGHTGDLNDGVRAALSNSVHERDKYDRVSNVFPPMTKTLQPSEVRLRKACTPSLPRAADDTQWQYELDKFQHQVVINPKCCPV